MDLKTMTLEGLKAFQYDMLKQFGQLKSLIDTVDKEIMSRGIPVEDSKIPENVKVKKG